MDDRWSKEIAEAVEQMRDHMANPVTREMAAVAMDMSPVQLTMTIALLATALKMAHGKAPAVAAIEAILADMRK